MFKPKIRDCLCSSVDRAVVSGTMCGGSIPFRCATRNSGNCSACCYDKEDKNLDDFREWLSDNLRYFYVRRSNSGDRACSDLLASAPVLEVRRGIPMKIRKQPKVTRKMILLLRQMMGRQTRRKTPVPRQIRMRRQPWKKPARK